MSGIHHPFSPLEPALPQFPVYPTMPGRPGAPVANPGSMAGFAGEGWQPQGQGGSLAGLQAHGVPVGYTPGGRPMVRAGMAQDQGFNLPPNLPGMPHMPGPPSGMFDGGVGGGGLFRPMAAVAPFDSGNQVRHLKQQRYQG